MTISRIVRGIVAVCLVATLFAAHESAQVRANPDENLVIEIAFLVPVQGTPELNAEMYEFFTDEGIGIVLGRHKGGVADGPLYARCGNEVLGPYMGSIPMLFVGSGGAVEVGAYLSTSLPANHQGIFRLGPNSGNEVSASWVDSIGTLSYQCVANSTDAVALLVVVRCTLRR